MALIQRSFEEGTDGVNVPNAAAVGATTIAGGPFSWRSSMARDGSLGIQVTARDVYTALRFATTSSMALSLSMWVYVPALPAGVSGRTIQTVRRSGGVIARLNLAGASGSTVIVTFDPNAGGTVTLGTLTAGQWYRISYWLSVATATTGQLHARVYDVSGALVGSEVTASTLNLGTVPIQDIDLGVLGNFAEQIVWGVDALQTSDGVTDFLPDMLGVAHDVSGEAVAVSTTACAATVARAASATTAAVSDATGSAAASHGSSGTSQALSLPSGAVTALFVVAGIAAPVSDASCAVGGARRAEGASGGLSVVSGEATTASGTSGQTYIISAAFGISHAAKVLTGSAAATSATFGNTSAVAGAGCISPAVSSAGTAASAIIGVCGACVALVALACTVTRQPGGMRDVTLTVTEGARSVITVIDPARSLISATERSSP